MLHFQSKIFLLFFFVTFFLVAWLGIAPSAIPVVQAQSSTLYTSLTAQNLDPAYPMNARVTYYNYSGSAVLTTTHTIQPYRGITINQPSQTGLPTNFAGAGILDADTPFGMVVKEYNGNVGTLGKNFRMDTYTGLLSTSQKTEFVLPQLMKNIYDSGSNSTYNSTVAIQNPSFVSSATVTIRYKQSTGEEYVHSGIVIQPGGFYSAELQNDSELAGITAFFGTGRVTSSQNVFVLAQHNTGGSLATFPGLSSDQAGTTVHLPQLLKLINDPVSGYTYSTGVVVMSLDGTPANLTLTYKSSDGSINVSETTTASPMGWFDQRYSSALASLPTFYGTGTLTANKSIVATVNVVTNYDANRGMRSATYRGFPSVASGKSTSVFLPLLSKNALDSASGVRQTMGVVGQLIGDSPTTVTITYYFTSGSLQRTATLTPSVPMFTFDPRYDVGIADGTVFTGVLTTNPPQPIVAVVSGSADSSFLGDVGAYYDGISSP